MLDGPIILDVVEPSDRRVDGPSIRQFLILTICFWVVEMLLSELRSVVDHSVKFGLYTCLRFFTAVLGCAECYVLHLVARTASRHRLAGRGALVLGLAGLAGLLNLGVGDALQNFSSYPVSDYGWGWRIYNATYWSLMFMAWAAIYLALGYSNDVAQQERRARLLEQSAHESQLRALRFQIDPHFLFNTLNSISALVIARRNVDAETMLTRMSSFFRETLATNPREDISLGQEIALQQIYLEIEKVRFPDLVIRIDLHPDAISVQVPPLLLQPLVENAVKFAVAGREGAAEIAIIVPRPEDGVARISICDNGSGAVVSGAKGTGTGLRNVRERLRARFGDRAAVRLDQRQGRGTIVQLTVPLSAPAARAVL